MSPDLRASVDAALRTIVDPCSIATGAPIDLIDMGLLVAVGEQDGTLVVTLRLTSPTCWQVGNIIGELQRKLRSLPEVRHVRCVVDMNAVWTPTMMAPEARRRLRQLRPQYGRSEI